MADKLVSESKMSNMLFNAKKTKIMVAGRQNTRVNLQIDGEQIEQAASRAVEIPGISENSQR